MLTKISLALGPRRPLNRQTAWGCFTTNLGLPGVGSLMAGRITGYFQVAVALFGLILTAYFGLRFISWFIRNWGRLNQPNEDIGVYFRDLWLSLRWALLGIAVYAFALLWSLVTSLSIINAARRQNESNQSNVPPFLRHPK